MTDFDGQAMDLFLEVSGMSPDERKARLQLACGRAPMAGGWGCQVVKRNE
jgi:hypothetical protein